MLNFRKPRHTYENSIAHWVRVISPRKHGSSSEGLNEGVQGGRSGCPGSDWNLVQPQALVGGEQDSGKNHLIVIAFPAVLLPSNERLRLDGVPVTTWAPTTPTLNTDCDCLSRCLAPLQRALEAGRGSSHHLGTHYAHLEYRRLSHLLLQNVCYTKSK